MASKVVVRPRANGTIAYRVAGRMVPGGRVTSETFPTPEDAERFRVLVDRVGFAAARAVRDASDRSDLDVPTLRTFLETVLLTVDAVRARGTAPEYRRMAERTFLPRLGDMPVDAITRPAVVAWVAWQREQETYRSKQARTTAVAAQRDDPSVVVPEPKLYSSKSIRNAHSLLSQTLAAARDAHLVTTNVAYKVPMPTDDERGEMTFLTENEFVILDAEIPARYRTLVALLFGTGLRWGEATALQPGDLDLDAPIPCIRVVRAWKKGEGSIRYLGSPKTRQARRTVSLPPQLVPLLREQAAGKAAGDLLFANRRGNRIGQATFHGYVWTPALERAALAKPPLTKKPRIHDLRHSHAAIMINRGMDLLTLQHRLGHESLKTTGDTYGHLMPDALATAARLAGLSMSGAYPQLEAAAVGLVAG